MKVLLAAQIGSPSQPEVDPLVARLEESLGGLGHEVDVFRFPVILAPAAAMDYTLAMGMLDWGSDGDRLLTLGWQCHLLRHPAKIAIIHHQDPLLSLFSPEANRPDQAYSRTAIASALRSARRVVVDQASTGETLRTLEGVHVLFGGARLECCEAVESWFA